MKLCGKNEKTESDENLILQLYQNADLRLPPTYRELEKFKQQLELEKSGFHHRPYEAMLKRAFIYRLTFLSLGLLFFFFTLFIQQQSINWLPYSYIFSNHQTAKNVILIVCLLLSFIAFGIGFIVSAEQEALHQFTRRAKKKLKRTFDKKMLNAKMNNNPFEIDQLNHLYKEKKEKMAEVHENSKHLLRLIHKVKDQKKLSTLFNEALLEANDHYHEIINRFKKS